MGEDSTAVKTGLKVGVITLIIITVFGFVLGVATMGVYGILCGIVFAIAGAQFAVFLGVLVGIITALLNRKKEKQAQQENAQYYQRRI